MIDRLNEQYGLHGHVHFAGGRGGMPRALIANDHADAEVYLHGAHVTAFAPRGEAPVLWLSPDAVFTSGRAIRGGVPIVWPWFGPHGSDSTKPQHGFARNLQWQVAATRACADGSSEITLELTENEHTLALWPHPFRLEHTVRAGRGLSMVLTSHNTGDEPVSLGAALHSYFSIADITQARVEGLEECTYLDQLTSRIVKRQPGPVTFDREVDRIYFGAPRDRVIVDATAGRAVHVATTGSRSTVVWNPWVDKSRAMADFPDEGYRNMLCVEPANAGDDVRVLAPGEHHTLTATISITP